MKEQYSAFIKIMKDLGDLPEDQLKLLKQKLRSQVLKKNDYFIRAEEKPEKFAYIDEGVFRIFCVSEDGVEKTLAFRSENQFIAPYTPVVCNQKVWYDIQALTDCKIHYITVGDFKSLNHFSWEILEKNYIIKLFLEKEERERSLLMDSAKSRYDKFLVDYPKLSKRVQQNYIASYLGITPVSLSRLKSQY